MRKLTAYGMMALGVVMVSSLLVSFVTVLFLFVSDLLMPYAPIIIGLVSFTVGVNVVGFLLDRRMEKKYK